MANPLDVHAMGQKLLELGFRRELLQDSMAIELSLVESVKKQQVLANEDLAGRSGRLLSAVLGSERSLVCIGFWQREIIYSWHVQPSKGNDYFIQPHHSFLQSCHIQMQEGQ